MLASTSQRVLVTGCSGFIGTHLCFALQAQGYEVIGLDIVSPTANSYRFLQADIRDAAALRAIAKKMSFDAVIHLAAVAEVVTPFQAFGELLSTNISGTLTVLEEFRPKLFLFPSTSAVYGDSRKEGAHPVWNEVHPIGIYGISKATAEMICQEWARSYETVAVNLRLGNVVGTRCRGLIPFLVCHVKKYPRGMPAAQLRGKGRLIRDYVPIEHVIEVMISALDRTWALGTCPTFNVGSGLRTSNRSVVGIASKVLRSQGYELIPDFKHPAAPGEVREVVFNIESTLREFDVQRPSRAAIAKSIREATLSYVD